MPSRDPKHINLRERKIFVFRQALDHAVENHRVRVSKGDSGDKTKKLKQLRDSIMSIPVNSETVEDNATRLDEALLNLVESAKHSINASSLDVSAQQTLCSELEGYAKSVSCSKCSKQVDKAPCNGGSGDYSLVDSSGYCLEIVKKPFHQLAHLTNEFYQSHVAEPNLLKSVTECEVVLDTVKYSKLPHNLPVTYRVSGKTKYEDEDGSYRSVVSLLIQTEEVDWSSILVSSHILIHELVVHAYQGLETEEPTMSRRLAAPEEAFSEGWMELVAHSLGRQWLAKTELAGSEEHADNLHNAKSNPDSSRMDLKTNRCLLGKQTAKKFRDLILPLLSDSSKVDFLALSARLNLVRITPTLRTEFVYALSDIITLIDINDLPLEKRQMFFHATKNILNERIQPSTYINTVCELAG